MKIETRNLIFWIIVLTSVGIVLTLISLSYEDTKETIKKIETATIIQSELLNEIRGRELNDEGKLKKFVNCLTETGVKFYGTYRCAFCVQQKEMFGGAATYLPYIECAPDRASPEALAMCEEANVGPIPDWRFPDGRQELGLLSLEKLVELSNCQLE